MHTARRPMYACAEDMGSWASVFELIVTISVVTNVALLGLTSNGVDQGLLQDTPSSRLWWVFLTEHALVLVKLGLDWLVADEPSDIALQVKQRNRMVEEQIKIISQRKAERQLNSLVDQPESSSSLPMPHIDAFSASSRARSSSRVCGGGPCTIQ
eukprot:JP447307.1.p2 GENE.JP447307.1~~JP447307.1.p2  ORF type:complete len:168 (-),score=47.88 JP447307.1:130-594(-)